MHHYVTLFNSNFLPQGLALYESLTCHASPFTLWVLCMDDKAKTILDRLSKPGIKAMAASEFETVQLLEIKQQRSLVEYCWTLTPMAPKIVFDRDQSVERVTYLDADLFFLKDPEPIHQEFRESGKSVMITEHAFDSLNDRSAQSGRFCVQFMTCLPLVLQSRLGSNRNLHQAVHVPAIFGQISRKSVRDSVRARHSGAARMSRPRAGSSGWPHFRFGPVAAFAHHHG